VKIVKTKLASQFLFDVKATTLTLQIWQFYPQISGTKVSLYTYNGLLIDINLTESVQKNLIS